MGSVGPFDLDTRHGLRSAVAARAPHGEIATFTSNVKGLEAAANMALQLRRLRIEHHMVLADAEGTCLQGQARWAWLGCGWSVGLPGFEAKYARGSQASRDVARLWSLWSAKWLLVARLVELRVNVLALDTDMMLQSDPYPVLTSPPVSRFEMVIVPEGSRVNLGFLYVRGKQCAPAGGVASVLWDVVRRLRLFTEDWPLLDRRGRHSSTAGLWDQGLFTDAITSAVAGELVYPYTYLQSPVTGVWRALGWPPPNATVPDLAAMHVVRWRDVGDRRLSRAWLKSEALRHRAPQAARRPPAFLPPRGHPQRQQWEGPQFGLLWVPLRVLDPVAHLRRRQPSAVTPGWLDKRVQPSARVDSLWPAASRRGSERMRGGSQGSGGGGAGRTELLLATPDWLYCLVGRWAITAGWPSLSPRSVCAVLHLVECRSQFGNWDASKAARPYVQRALGFWLLPEPLPQLPDVAQVEDTSSIGGVGGGQNAGVAVTAASRGQPNPPHPAQSPPRAVRLSPTDLAVAGQARTVGALLNSLQRLALYAAITGRTPVIPSVPCSSRWLHRNAFGRAGVADDYVIQTANRTAEGYHHNESDGGIECHLSMGGHRCLLPTVLPAWTRASSGALSFLPADAAPELAKAPRITASFAATALGSAQGAGENVASVSSRGGGGGGGGGGAGCPRGRRLTLDVAALRAMGERRSTAPMLEVGAEITLSPLAGGAEGGVEGGRAVLGKRSLRSRCHGADRIGEEQLTLIERRRLDALRAACPAFFGVRGTAHGQLDWIHRRRL